MMAHAKMVPKLTFLLKILIAAIFLNNLFFIIVDGRELNEYERYHFENAILASANEKGIVPYIKNIMDPIPLFGEPTIYPPLIYIIYGSVWEIIGYSHKMGLILQQLFLLILFYSVYRIGKNLKDDLTGYLCAFLTLSAPFVVNYSRQLTLEMPLISIVALAMSLVLKPFSMIRTRDYVLFGILMAASSLIKQNFIFNFIGPLCLIILLLALKKDYRNTIVVISFVLLCIVSIFVFIPPRIVTNPIVLPMFQKASVGLAIKETSIQLLNLCENLFFVSLGPVNLILGAISLALITFRLLDMHGHKDKKNHCAEHIEKNFSFLILATWILIPLAIYAFSTELFVFNINAGFAALSILSAYIITGSYSKRIFYFLLIITLINGIYISYFGILNDSKEVEGYIGSHIMSQREGDFDRLACLLSVKCLKGNEYFVNGTFDTETHVTLSYFTAEKPVLVPADEVLRIVGGSGPSQVDFISVQGGYYDGRLLLGLDDLDRKGKIRLRYNLGSLAAGRMDEICKGNLNNTPEYVIMTYNSASWFEDYSEIRNKIDGQMIYSHQVGDYFHTEVYEANCSRAHAINT
jgi:hypothetical protein